MENSPATDKLSVRTKLLYGIGDAGNAIINSAVQFSLMVFYTIDFAMWLFLKQGHRFPRRRLCSPK